MKLRKILGITLALILSLSLLAACGQKPAAADPAKPAAEKVVITVGASVTPHAEILAVIKPILEAKGYILDIKEFTDYVLPNTTLNEGDLDANYFQHTPYLELFNKEHGTKIVSVKVVHYEPMGIFPGKTKAIADLQDGAKIAIPNDGSNEARALLLLEKEGLIKLKEGADFNATKLDIVENPKNLEIIEMAAEQIALSLPDVDLGIINGNYALQAGLNAGKDALSIESSDSKAAQTYGNVLAVREGDEQTEKTLALIDALNDPAVKKFIEETYEGAVVFID